MCVAMLLAVLAVVSLTHAATVTVSTEANLKAALKSDTTVVLGADIALTAQLAISGLVNLVIDGASHALDGQGKVSIFSISGSSTVVSFRNLTVAHGYTKVYGGGFYITGGSSISMEAVQIIGNAAPYYSGGGIYMTSGKLMMSDCIINENSANYGGGIHFSGAQMQLNGCVISGNKADAFGGGVRITGGVAELNACAIERNSALTGTNSGGGGLHVTSGSTKLNGCVIEANTATDRGGGLYLQSQWPVLALDGCAFLSNVSPAGSDLFLYQSPTLQVFSACTAGTFNKGSGDLACEYNTGSGNLACPTHYPANLLNQTCSTCPSGQFSCCGAFACANEQPTCSTAQIAACP